MKWRTDKPTADIIVAKLNNGNYSILERLSSGKYCVQDKSIGYDILHGENMFFIYEEEIQKWADLEEDETATENNSLKEEVVSYFQGYWPGTETAEQCNTDMHFTPLAIMRLVEHFAKWGAEHLKN